MKRYILLAVTWFLILASIIYFWVTYGTQPHVALWVILAILSLIPVAERLKIGNWFEFSKKVDKIKSEIGATQKEVLGIKTD